MTKAHAALRRGRRSLPGHAYLLTSTTAGRRPLFADADVAFVAARVLADSAHWAASRVLAWVLMPDHWHALCVLGEGDTLARRMGWLKAESARGLGRRFPALGPVWGRAFHDRALRGEDDLRSAARYVVLNPVRAGLVHRIGDYPFWDAVWMQPGHPDASL